MEWLNYHFQNLGLIGVVVTLVLIQWGHNFIPEWNLG